MKQLIQEKLSFEVLPQSMKLLINEILLDDVNSLLDYNIGMIEHLFDDYVVHYL